MKLCKSCQKRSKAIHEFGMFADDVDNLDLDTALNDYPNAIKAYSPKSMPLVKAYLIARDVLITEIQTLTKQSDLENEEDDVEDDEDHLNG